jgi:hypothetical protein
MHREPLPPLVVDYLATGDYARIRGEGWFKAFDVAGHLMRAVAQGGRLPEWDEHADEITAAWIERYPGSRPYAWWAFEADAPRDCVGVDVAAVPAWVWRQHRGIAVQWHQLDLGTTVHLESEAHYLRRYQLLEPGECTRIALAAFAPEAITIGSDDEDSEAHHDGEE